MSKRRAPAKEARHCPVCTRLFYADEGFCPGCGWSPENDRFFLRQEVKARG